MYETRGTARFFYSYDSNGILYSVKYTLTDSSSPLTYYYTHNSRGDIVGIYNEAGELRAHYEYDAWDNVLSVTNQNGNAITSAPYTHLSPGTSQRIPTNGRISPVIVSFSGSCTMVLTPLISLLKS